MKIRDTVKDFLLSGINNTEKAEFSEVPDSKAGDTATIVILIAVVVLVGLVGFAFWKSKKE